MSGSFTDTCEVSPVWLRVRISEKASGRVITSCDPDDGYYPFEAGFEDGSTEKISSAGYAEICCFDGEDIRSTISRVLEERAVSARFGRDVPIDAETLNEIISALPQCEGLTEIPQGEDEIPDPADAQALAEHPERFAFEYVLEEYNGQKTRN